MKKKASLHNLGCKVNAYELEAMQQLLEEEGYEIVPFEAGADLYLINTCTVTNIADRKSRQMLHKAKKMNPSAIVVATGCYAQTKAEELDKDEAIDLVIGNDRKGELITLIKTYEADRAKKLFRKEYKEIREYEELHIDRTLEHTRAFLKVQDGCNQFCTYCIIPYARGRVRSRRPQDVVREVERLAASGTREIVLTGIHLSSYGVDLQEEENLLTLIQKVHEVEGISRIRLGSLEPGIITEEFAREISALPKICPHFHLSLQSGCDTVLKRMNRRYTSGEFAEKCALLRKYFDDPALTTDIITGFPGETEEEFLTTKEFVEKIHFFETHVFPYSRREGTKAAAMEGQLTEAVKKQRSHVLLELDEQRRKEYLESRLGLPTEVLMEEQEEICGELYWVGHTREYQKAGIKSSENLENQMVTITPEKICHGVLL